MMLDPAQLARRLGAQTFGGPRWWTLAECAARLGYSPATLGHLVTDGRYAADVPRRRGVKGRWEIWCATPPPMPPDPRRGRPNDAATRAAIVAAVQAAGGPPGAGKGRGDPFWPRIAAQCGVTLGTAIHHWDEYRRYG
jgi:hypothetical protein